MGLELTISLGPCLRALNFASGNPSGEDDDTAAMSLKPGLGMVSLTIDELMRALALCLTVWLAMLAVNLGLQEKIVLSNQKPLAGGGREEKEKGKIRGTKFDESSPSSSSPRQLEVRRVVAV